MGTPLNTNGGQAGPPSIKLRSKGDYVDCAVINEEVVPALVFGTRDQAVTATGKPKTQDRVTVIVIRGNGVITEDGTDRPVVADEIATIYFEGQNRWDPDRDDASTDGFKSWSGAKKDLGQLQVGDVLRWRYEDDLQGKGAQPRKIRTVKLRHPKTEETALALRCEELHRNGVAIPIGAGPDENEPF